MSYARADGEALARDIHRRLTAEENLTVWLDRIDMAGGRDWWEQITGMLRSPMAEHLVLVLTPEAVRSLVVRREWRYALREGVRVTPVIDRANKPDRSQLPKMMQREHSNDPAVDEDWRRLVRLLEGPSGQMRVPFMAGDAPAGFVERPAAYAAVKHSLLDERGDAVAITAALRGAGGFGKTTLARALCHDDDVQEAYHHGVLWTTLGESPGDVVGRLNTLTRALAPEARLENDLDLAIAEWRKALDQRRCLIVIDDVWRRADLAPFLQGGPECARLVTTRDAGVLPGVAVARIPVDAMDETEAVALLARDLPPEKTALAAQLRALSETLGCWPLLLDLANARLRARIGKGADLAAALDHVEQGLDRKGVGAFDATNPEARSDAAAGSLDLSIEALIEDEGHQAALRLEALGVFVEDADVPIALATALWEREAGLDPFDGDTLLDRVDDLSFFVRFDRGVGVLRLHDVVRARLRQRLGPDRLRALDGVLAAAICARAGADWAALGTDAYAVAHLPAHLWGAGNEAGLDALLTDARWLGAALDAHRLAGAGCAPLVAAYGLHARTPAALGAARMIRSFAHELTEDGGRLVVPLLLGGVDDDALRTRWRAAALRPALLPMRATLAPAKSELLRLVHEDQVYSVAFSPDGARLATGSRDNTARLWDLATGREIARFEGHGKSVASVAFSPDGARLATASHDKAARLWNLATGREIARLEGHRNFLNCVAFSPDGARLATGAGDRTARLWDLAAGREIVRLDGHGGDVASVAFSPDGALLATGSSDNTARLWDLNSGREIDRLEGHEGRVKSVAVSSDGARLATGSEDDTARLWDLTTGREIARLEGHRLQLLSVAFSPDGARLATASFDRTARLWDLATKREIAQLHGHTGAVSCVMFSPDGVRLATGSHDGTARIWDIKKDYDITPQESHEGNVLSVAFSPDGSRLATGSDDRTARLWDLASGREIARFEGHEADIKSVAFSPDGKRLATTGSLEGTARLWDLASGSEIARLESSEIDSVRLLSCVVFSPDGALLAIGNGSGPVRLWDVVAEQDIAWVDHYTGKSASVAFSPDGARLAIACGGGEVELWHLATGRKITRLKGHENFVSSVAFSPDGALLATGSSDNTARLWDLNSGREVARLEAHRNVVTSLAFSPDGARLATGSWDNTARIWDLASGCEIARLPFGAHVHSVAVRADGCIAVGDAAGRWHLLEFIA
ncbi:TIR domain-containing protein [Rubrimonas cliftonensis]|uniref:TIR domain-containing protein n=1 Tax=Rubrimonas cliftonensis TaxID=89524 RepID=UPI001587C28E|nr:TIR domain-containing protein [Rubrimonas cliftonensis]